jgi:hypothetical protein
VKIFLIRLNRDDGEGVAWNFKIYPFEIVFFRVGDGNEIIGHKLI